MTHWKRFIHRPLMALSECHAATIAELPGGTLVSAWYMESPEKASEAAIYGATLAPEAEEWNSEGLLVNSPHFSEGNPVLFVGAEGTLWLFYVTLLGGRWDTCQVRYLHSHDQGLTWNAPVLLRGEWGWMTGCKPLSGKSGALLLPLYEAGGTAVVMRSEDGGRQWQESNRVHPLGGATQPALAFLSDGRLMMTLCTRTPHNGTLWQAFSADEGRTWSEATPTSLPNPGSRIDIARLVGGRLALAFNDSPQQHAPLTLALSEDDGKTWPHRFDVETAPGECSDPSVIQTRDGLLHVVYTYQRTHIAHVACDEEWILSHARPIASSGGES